MKITSISNAKYAQTFKGEIITNADTVIKLATEHGVNKNIFDNMREQVKKNPHNIHIDAQNDQFVVYSMRGKEPIVESGTRFLDVWDAFIKNLNQKK